MASADVLDGLIDVPEGPDRDGRAALLDELGQLVAAGGWERLARAPVVPGPTAFPDPWARSPLGVATVARRLLWHAGIGDLAVVVADRRGDAGPMPDKVPTDVELAGVERGRARLDLYSIGDDDVVGAIAHEVAAAVAVRWAAADAPYRGTTPVVDADTKWRGSIAAVYLGLGVLAANAAFQEYRGGAYQPTLGYAPAEYHVVHVGGLTIAELGFLLAVQAQVRDAGLPDGLSRPQAEHARAWHKALAGRGDELRAHLGVPAPATWPALERPAPAPLPELDEEDVVLALAPRPAPPVYRVGYTRTGSGVVVGAVTVGVGAAAMGAPPAAIGIAVMAGAVAGYAAGHAIKIDRCSECVTVLPAAAGECPHCGGRVVGRLASRNDRLELDGAHEELGDAADLGPEREPEDEPALPPI